MKRAGANRACPPASIARRKARGAPKEMDIRTIPSLTGPSGSRNLTNTSRIGSGTTTPKTMAASTLRRLSAAASDSCPRSRPSDNLTEQIAVAASAVLAGPSNQPRRAHLRASARSGGAHRAAARQDREAPMSQWRPSCSDMPSAQRCSWPPTSRGRFARGDQSQPDSEA